MALRGLHYYREAGWAGPRDVAVPHQQDISDEERRISVAFMKYPKRSGQGGW